MSDFSLPPSGLARRRFLKGAAAVSLAPTLAGLGGCVANSLSDRPYPIVFVHGNGDTAALWTTTLWRFESNLHPRDLLFAIDFRNPLSRMVDAEPQANRSSADEQRDELAAFVAEVKRRTGAPRVGLVGSSRGGNAIRHYIKNGGGAAHVSHAVLCGTPNHGVVVSSSFLAGNEFNGAHSFLRQLNEGKDEVVRGVNWTTIRSDKNDKFAQPDGRHLGQPQLQTGVGYDGPELKGANNIVLPKLDHREVAFHEAAFPALFRGVRDFPPFVAGITPEAEPVLNGKVNAMPNGQPTNAPIAGAQVEIFEVDPATAERRNRVHTKTTGADGLWGPFVARNNAFYEFVITAPGYAITHVYRSPFPRGSQIVHLRPGLLTDADRQAGSSITFTRPRGYFGKGRDTMSLDGKDLAGVPEGVPTVASSTLRLPAGPARTVVGRFNLETIAARSWPTSENRTVQIELHY